jgi:hypothetical protein
MTDISGDAVRSEALVFNRVTTGVFYDKWFNEYGIRICYWSTEHNTQRNERSKRTFPTEELARAVATRLAEDIGERIRA